MKVLICFLLIALTSCASKKVVEVKKPQSWREVKRECHTFYLNSFGLSAKDTIGMCKEELERKE
jgi:hypothetical protein